MCRKGAFVKLLWLLNLIIYLANIKRIYCKPFMICTSVKYLFIGSSFLTRLRNLALTVKDRFGSITGLATAPYPCEGRVYPVPTVSCLAASILDRCARRFTTL